MWSAENEQCHDALNHVCLKRHSTSEADFHFQFFGRVFYAFFVIYSPNKSPSLNLGRFMNERKRVAYLALCFFSTGGFGATMHHKEVRNFLLQLSKPVNYTYSRTRHYRTFFWWSDGFIPTFLEFQSYSIT